MTFKEILEKVIEKLQENEDPQYWSVSEIKDAINRGYLEFVIQTECLKARIPGVVKSGYLRIPLDAVKIKAVYWNGAPLTPVSEWQLDRTYKYKDFVSDNWSDSVSFSGNWLDAKGTPVFYTIYNNLIKLVPSPTDENNNFVVECDDDFGLLLSDDFGLFLPTSDDEDLLLESQDEYFGGVSCLLSLTSSAMIEYVRAPEKLVSDEDIPEIPIPYHDALVHYALYELFSREGNTQNIQKASFYLRLFEQAVESYKRFFTNTSYDLNLPFQIN